MLSIPGFAILLQANMNAQSYNGHNFDGPMLPAFCLAIATGVITATLTLTGEIPAGIGLGGSFGVGITVSGNNIAENIVNAAKQIFGTQSPTIQMFADAIGAATEAIYGQASLTSTTNGSATFASFSGAIDQMAAIIVASAPFVGSQWPNLAKVIATGICQEVGENGTATLAGAGAPGGGPGIVQIS